MRAKKARVIAREAQRYAERKAESVRRFNALARPSLLKRALLWLMSRRWKPFSPVSSKTLARKARKMYRAGTLPMKRPAAGT